MYLLAAMYGLLLVRVVVLFAIQFMAVDKEVDITVQGFYLNPSNFRAIS